MAKAFVDYWWNTDKSCRRCSVCGKRFFRQQIIHPSELFISDVSSVVNALEFSHPRTIISPEANFSVNVDDLSPTKALNFPYLLFQKRP